MDENPYKSPVDGEYGDGLAIAAYRILTTSLLAISALAAPLLLFVFAWLAWHADLPAGAIVWAILDALFIAMFVALRREAYLPD